MRTALLVLAIVFVSSACHKPKGLPTSFGMLSDAVLSKWQADCALPIEHTRVCGRGAPSPFCGYEPHQLNGWERQVEKPRLIATQRWQCTARDSWTIWTDDQRNIMGLCATEPGDKRSRTPLAQSRLLALISRHMGERVTALVLDDNKGVYTGASGDRETQVWYEATGTEWVYLEVPNLIDVSAHTSPRDAETSSCVEYVPLKYL